LRALGDRLLERVDRLRRTSEEVILEGREPLLVDAHGR
jgi:hypothetical protein